MSSILYLSFSIQIVGPNCTRRIWYSNILNPDSDGDDNDGDDGDDEGNVYNVDFDDDDDDGGDNDDIEVQIFRY